MDFCLGSLEGIVRFDLGVSSYPIAVSLVRSAKSIAGLKSLNSPH